MKYYINIILLVLCASTVEAQTNISGGIYSNSTWTKANSPYVITDTVVVFPNVILTIEAGVTVLFADYTQLEIRQASLIAVGNSTDSILFTSNSPTPFPGIYSGIFLNAGNLSSSFNYCSFGYATTGVNATVSGSVNVNHSLFFRNYTGFRSIGSNFGTSSIDSSIFTNNESGLIVGSPGSAVVNSCTFSFNTSVGYSLTNGYAMTRFCDFLNNATGLSMTIENSLVSNCHFSNNVSGLEGGTGAPNDHHRFPNYVRNCLFDFNQTALENIDELYIDSCTLVRNQTGYHGSISIITNCIVDSNTVTGFSSCNDSIVNCKIRYNGDGIQSICWIAIIGNDIEYNTGTNIKCAGFAADITGNVISHGNVGINLNSNANIGCNTICNNTTYDLYYTATSTLDASHNYWCTDSTSLEYLIYDGYDNISYGLVNFTPFDSLCSPSIIAVNEITSKNSIKIYPNPATDYLTLELSENFPNSEITLFNAIGEQVYSSTGMQKQIVNIANLATGIYIIQVRSNKDFFIQRFMKL